MYHYPDMGKCHQHISLIEIFCQTGTENGGLHSETASQLFFSTVSVCDLFWVVLQRFIFFRHVRTSHARSVRYDDDMRAQGLGM